MKRLLLLNLILIITSNIFSQSQSSKINTQGYDLNYKDPKSVVNGFIHACKNKDVYLCTLVFLPFIESGEFKDIKNQWFKKDPKFISGLYDLRESYINGETEHIDSKSCIVPVYFITPTNKYQEKIYLTKIYDNWYITSF